MFILIWVHKDEVRSTINLPSLHIRKRRFSLRYSVLSSVRKKNTFEYNRVIIFFIYDWILWFAVFLCICLLQGVLASKFEIELNRSVFFLEVDKSYAGPILESKGMGAIFQKKGKERLKKGHNIWKFEEKSTKFKIQ